MAESIEKRRSNLALLPGIVDRPQRTLEQVLAYPRWRWVLPALICLASIAILLVVSLPYLTQQAQQQMASQLSSLTDAQRQQVQSQMDVFTGPLVLIGGGMVSSVLGLALGWLIGATILFFGLLIGGLEIGFSQIFAGVAWTWLPFGVRNLVNAGWAYFSGAAITNPGLSYFVATGDQAADAKNLVWILAGQLDLFFLWHLVLVFFLIRAAKSRGGAVLLTLIYALLYLALRVLPALGLSSLVPGA